MSKKSKQTNLSSADRQDQQKREEKKAALAKEIREWFIAIGALLAGLATLLAVLLDKQTISAR